MGTHTVTGAHSIPQQLCPVARNAFDELLIFPIIGSASGEQGRIHACAETTLPIPIEDRAPKESSAAWTRSGLAFTYSSNERLRMGTWSEHCCVQHVLHERLDSRDELLRGGCFCCCDALVCSVSCLACVLLHAICSTNAS